MELLQLILIFLDYEPTLLESAYTYTIYNQDISVSLPTSISFELSDGQTVEFPIISFEVTGLSTPNGINYNCSDNCFFEQGTSNTLYFSGLPTEAGLFDINISELFQ